MFTKLIAKLLKKKLYKSKITILGDDFVATHDSNSLLESLKWTLHGIHEANATQPEQHKKSISTTNGIYGHICEFKLFSVTRTSITICGYKTPKNEDILFMTEQMVYIPQKILNTLREQDAHLQDLEIMTK